MPPTTIYTENGISLSQSGQATQVVLWGHGGYEEQVKWKPSVMPAGLQKKLRYYGKWKERKTVGDGFTRTLYKTYFYTGHGHFGVSGQVLDSFMEWTAAEVKFGLSVKMLAMRKAGIDAQKAQIGEAAWIDRMLELPKNIGTVRSIAPAGTDVWNYNVSAFNPNLPADAPNISRVTSHKSGKMPADIDMVYIENGARKLAEVFAACNASTFGHNYEVFHFLPCRSFSGNLNDPYTK